jgi:hypothetical protein
MGKGTFVALMPWRKKIVLVNRAFVGVRPAIEPYTTEKRLPGQQGNRVFFRQDFKRARTLDWA